MGYDPKKHHRKSIRLKGYDYSSTGAYFVTICVKNRECLFGEIRTGKMILNDFGKIIAYHWKNIPSHFQNAKLDEFIVMPNHFHGILWLVGNGDAAAYSEEGLKHSDNKSEICRGEAFPENNSSKRDNFDSRRRGEAFHLKSGDNSPFLPGNASPQQQQTPTPERPKGTKPGSLSAIIQNFSSVTTRKINRIRKTPGGKLWQRNYYDRIIRNDNELYNVRQYIRNNALKWELDSENSGNGNSPE